jgi:hypothetical protein
MFNLRHTADKNNLDSYCFRYWVYCCYLFGYLRASVLLFEIELPIVELQTPFRNLSNQNLAGLILDAVDDDLMLETFPPADDFYTAGLLQEYSNR